MQLFDITKDGRLVTAFAWRLAAWILGPQVPYAGLAERPNIFEGVGALSCFLLSPVLGRLILSKWDELVRGVSTFTGIVLRRSEHVIQSEAIETRDYQISAGGRTWVVPKSAWSALATGMSFRIDFDPVTGQTWQVYGPK